MNWTTSQKIQATKTLTWALISMTITFFVTWIITSSWEFGLGVSVSERVIKIFAYYPHERWWHKRYKLQKQEAKKNA